MARLWETPHLCFIFARCDMQFQVCKLGFVCLTCCHMECFPTVFFHPIVMNKLTLFAHKCGCRFVVCCLPLFFPPFLSQSCRSEQCLTFCVLQVKILGYVFSFHFLQQVARFCLFNNCFVRTTNTTTFELNGFLKKSGCCSYKR